MLVIKNTTSILCPSWLSYTIMTVFYPYSDLVLASASPRRAALLQQLDLPFKQRAIDFDESRHSDEPVADYALRMAREKALCAWQTREHDGDKPLILAADTCGELDGELLSKPVDFADAARLLRHLSGREHTIFSAFALYDGQHLHANNVRSVVRFRAISDTEIARYWATGEPRDKAGAYAIQGIGAQFVAHLSGSYSAVMGLPLFELTQALQQFSIRTL